LPNLTLITAGYSSSNKETRNRPCSREPVPAHTRLPSALPCALHLHYTTPHQQQQQQQRRRPFPAQYIRIYLAWVFTPRRGGSGRRGNKPWSVGRSVGRNSASAQVQSGPRLPRVQDVQDTPTSLKLPRKCGPVAACGRVCVIVPDYLQQTVPAYYRQATYLRRRLRVTVPIPASGSTLFQHWQWNSEQAICSLTVHVEWHAHAHAHESSLRPWKPQKASLIWLVVRCLAPPVGLFPPSPSRALAYVFLFHPFGQRQVWCRFLRQPTGRVRDRQISRATQFPGSAWLQSPFFFFSSSCYQAVCHQ